MSEFLGIPDYDKRKDLITQKAMDIQKRHEVGFTDALYMVIIRYENQLTRPNDAWISVEDVLPEEEGYYLVAFNYGSGQMPYAVNPTRYWNGTIFVTMATVKHWMPLPTPPKQSREGEEG